MATKEDIIIGHLESISEDVKSLRKETASQSVIITRIDTEFKAHTSLTHPFIDSRLDSLESFEEKTGEHDLSKFREQETKKKEWKTWSVRAIVGGIITLLITVVGVFIKFLL